MATTYMAGTTRIKKERRRQAEKGYTAEHDVEHNNNGELVSVAEDLLDHVQGKNVSDDFGIIEEYGHDKERLLEIAGALIAGELDRLSKVSTDADETTNGAAHV